MPQEKQKTSCPKVKHYNKNKAKNIALELISIGKGTYYRGYFCYKCFAYHLTSTKTSGKNKSYRVFEVGN